MSTASADSNGRVTPDETKVLRLNRADAASIALKVALNDRTGKSSPRWMVRVAEEMGVRSTGSVESAT